MKVGYACVSTGERKLDLQLDAFQDVQEAGCEKIYTQRLHGVIDWHPSLEDAPKDVRPRDTLVVWHLNRFDPPLKDLVLKVE